MDTLYKYKSLASCLQLVTIIHNGHADDMKLKFDEVSQFHRLRRTTDPNSHNTVLSRVSTIKITRKRLM